MARRFFFVFAVIVFDSKPILKVFSLQLQSMLMAVYLVNSMPFKIQKVNYFEIFNELTILLLSYSMLLLTDFYPT